MKKLLIFMITIVAVFMVGFASVKAADINLFSSNVFFENAISPIDGGKRDFHMKQVSGNNNAYAFCLDSEEVFYPGGYVLNSKLNYDSEKIKNVILNAYLTGLGTDKNVYGNVSNDELYMITQMAVWYAAHGNSTNGMLPNDTYINWLNQEGYEYRKSIYSELKDVVSEIDIPEISIKSSQGGNNEYLTASAKKDNFGSGQFKIIGPENLTYTVSIDESQSSAGACVLYQGECEKSQEIPAGKNFRLRADYVANQEVKVSATVKSSEYLTDYTFNLYQPDANGNYQNAAVFIPQFDKFETKISATGRVDSKKKVSSTLTISKKDLSTKKEVKDAYLQIFRITDIGREIEPIYQWKSNGSDYVINNIDSGKYVLIEVLPNPNYESYMIIDQNKVSEYEFEVVEGRDIKIEVYNELKTEKIETPITDFNTKSYAVGCFICVIGFGIIFINKKRDNI